MPSEWECSPSKANSEGHLLGGGRGLKPSEWECSPSKANSEGHLLWERGGNALRVGCSQSKRNWGGGRREH